MDEKLIKKYNSILPDAKTLESLVSKGKIGEALTKAKLTLSGIKYEDFLAWNKNPEKYVCKHNPTHYEQLMAVGYHPQRREMMGVVYIKQIYGYGGLFGSMQHVRFYVDWNDDGDFMDIGEDQEIGSVHVIDPGPENASKLPIEYAVRKRLILPPPIIEMLENRRCVRKLRAILSWNTVPPANSPNWKPFWGNVVNTNIRFHR